VRDASEAQRRGVAVGGAPPRPCAHRGGRGAGALPRLHPAQHRLRLCLRRRQAPGKHEGFENPTCTAPRQASAAVSRTSARRTQPDNRQMLCRSDQSSRTYRTPRVAHISQGAVANVNGAVCKLPERAALHGNVPRYELHRRSLTLEGSSSAATADGTIPDGDAAFVYVHAE
jgi:hypothetical protein